MWFCVYEVIYYHKHAFLIPVRDNQQMLKGVVSFYYTHEITPTCFGS
jgi:hypothetical protein